MTSRKDLTPIAVVARVMNALVVRADNPIRSVAELVAAAKAKPGQLSFASSGAGSSPHLAAELFKVRTGTDITHVPYRGSAPGLADLLGGRITMSIDNLPNVLPHVQDGRLRALAVTGTERDPTMPDVPTFAEAGLPRRRGLCLVRLRRRRRAAVADPRPAFGDHHPHRRKPGDGGAYPPCRRHGLDPRTGADGDADR